MSKIKPPDNFSPVSIDKEPLGDLSNVPHQEVVIRMAVVGGTPNYYLSGKDKAQPDKPDEWKELPNPASFAFLFAFMLNVIPEMSKFCDMAQRAAQEQEKARAGIIAAGPEHAHLGKVLQ